MTQTETFLQTRKGEMLILRLLHHDDGAALGRYFAGLSAETRRRFGPHPLDQATADTLCATINPKLALRWIAVTTRGEIVAYVIVEMSVQDYEIERYRGYGIGLAPGVDCRIAPSVADAYQNAGIGQDLLRHIMGVTREIGRRWMILMGGTQSSNTRAIHFYRTLNFEHVGSFEHPPGMENLDMIVAL